MTTATKILSQVSDAKVVKRIFSGEAVVGYAVLGCLVAGTIGIIKAIGMADAGAAACLLAAVAAFGTVCYVYFRKS
jgi:4-amino-4-deoxy-L-arabinose transferase-like glycosyltransferase